MKVSRNTVDNALFNLVKGAFGWKIASKHWQDWANTTNQPAMYLKRMKDGASQVLRGQNKYHLKYEIWVYAQFETNSPNADPYVDVVNPIMEALDTSLNPPPEADFQFLGIPGGVANARWDGDADIVDGSLDGQVCIVIPVSVFVSA